MSRAESVRLAIVLGGGRSSRMGRDKMAVEINGQTLLRRTVNAALTWAPDVIVVAPQPDDWQPLPGVRFILEDPPFGGPVAGIDAALEMCPRDSGILLLAGDLARPDQVVEALSACEGILQREHPSLDTPPAADHQRSSAAPNLEHRHLPPPQERPGWQRNEGYEHAWLPARIGSNGFDGIVLEDEDGLPQRLAGLYKATALLSALGALGTSRDASVRRLMRNLRLARLPVPSAVSRDLDTAADLERTFGPEEH